MPCVFMRDLGPSVAGSVWRAVQLELDPAADLDQHGPRAGVATAGPDDVGRAVHVGRDLEVPAGDGGIDDPARRSPRPTRRRYCGIARLQVVCRTEGTKRGPPA